MPLFYVGALEGALPMEFDAPVLMLLSYRDDGRPSGS